MEQSLRKLIPKHQNSKGKIKSLKELKQEAAEYASRISALALEEETARSELELASTRKQIKREGLEATITAVNSDPKNDPDAERNKYHGDTRDYTYRKSYQHADLAPGDEVKISDVEASWNHPDQADPLALFYVEGIALSPLFKLAGRAGEFALGRMGNLWARNRIIGREFLNQSNRLQLPRTSTRLYTYNGVGNGEIQLLSESGEPNGHMILRNPLSSDLKGKLIGFVNKLNGATHTSEDMYNVAVEHAKEELLPGLESGHDLYHPEITLHVTSKFPYEERLPLSFQNINGKWLLAPDTKAPYNIRLLTGQSGRPTPNRIFELTNHRLKVDDVYDGNLPNPRLVSEYWPSIRYGNIPAEGRTSLKMFERPTKTSLSERLGIPRGDRGNLSRILQEALEDLELYINSGQFRLYPTWKDGKIIWQSVRDPEAYITNIKQSPRAINYDTMGFDAYSDIPFEGEASIHSGYASAGGDRIKLTPASVETGDSSLPNTIPSNVMRSFWENVEMSRRPGTYFSGDQMASAPLGSKLISDFRDFGRKAIKYRPKIATFPPEYHGDVKYVEDLSQPFKYKRSGKWWNDIIDDLYSNYAKWAEEADNPNGLSPDSYMALLKQGNRPGYSLRFDVYEPMTGWNNTAVENKHIYDLFLKVQQGDMDKNEFIKVFNEWVEPYGGMPARLIKKWPDGEEIIGIPHPFVYKKKLGGKL